MSSSLVHIQAVCPCCLHVLYTHLSSSWKLTIPSNRIIHIFEIFLVKVPPAWKFLILVQFLVPWGIDLQWCLQLFHGLLNCDGWDSNCNTTVEFWILNWFWMLKEICISALILWSDCQAHHQYFDYVRQYTSHLIRYYLLGHIQSVLLCDAFR